MDLIIGRGSVGIELSKVIANHTLISKQNFKLPKDPPSIIWLAAGFGSVESCEADPIGAVQTHIELPLRLVKEYPDSKLVVFSSDYVVDTHFSYLPSLYAATKAFMEKALLLSNRPNTAVVRISTVYSKDTGLPYKLQRAYERGQGAPITAVNNLVSPTPAWWIAENLVKHQDSLFKEHPVVINLAPTSVSVRNLAQHLGMRTYDGGFDRKRPITTEIGCSLFPTPKWEDLMSDPRTQL